MDLDKYLEILRGVGILPERTVRMICEQVKEIIIEESNVQLVSAPVTVCGDIHG